MTTKINVREYRRGNQKLDNPEKLETYGTQDEEKQKVVMFRPFGIL
jgi:hypothetical protein